LLLLVASRGQLQKKIRVEPRDREIAILKQQVADVKQNNCELNAAYDPYRTQIPQLLAKNQRLEKNSG
jgi:hypothetical protein